MRGNEYVCGCGFQRNPDRQCPVCRGIPEAVEPRKLNFPVHELCGVAEVHSILVWGEPGSGKSTAASRACRHFQRPAYVSGEESPGSVERRMRMLGVYQCTLNPEPDHWPDFDFIVYDSVQTLHMESESPLEWPPHVLVNHVNVDGLAYGGTALRHWCDAEIRAVKNLDDAGLDTAKSRTLYLEKDRGGHGIPSLTFSLNDWLKERA